MKFTIMEERTFTGGSLKGITIEIDSISYPTKIQAITEAAKRVGSVGGGAGFGSEYKVNKARIVKN